MTSGRRPRLYCSRQTKNAGAARRPRYSVWNTLLGRLNRTAVRASRSPGLRFRSAYVHLLVVHQHAAGIDHCMAIFQLPFPRFIESRRRRFLGILDSDRGPYGWASGPARLTVQNTASSATRN